MRKKEDISTIFSDNSLHEKLEINIKTMVFKLKTSQPLNIDSTESDHWCHRFSPKIIGVKQECDLPSLSF